MNARQKIIDELAHLFERQPISPSVVGTLNTAIDMLREDGGRLEWTSVYKHNVYPPDEADLLVQCEDGTITVARYCMETDRDTGVDLGYAWKWVESEVIAWRPL